MEHTCRYTPTIMSGPVVRFGLGYHQGKEREFLYVSDRIAGRFVTKADAEAEEERLCRLALRDGHAITTKITYVPQTEQEGDEAAFHERLP